MMLKNLSLGVYYPGDSLVHRLQARTKLLLMAFFIAWIVLANHHYWHFVPYAAIVTCALVGTRLAGIRLHDIWKRIWLLLLLLALGAITSLSSQEGDKHILATLGPILTSYGLVRLLLLVGSGILAALFAVSLFPQVRETRVGRRLKRVRVLLIIALLAALVSLLLVSGTPDAGPFPIGPLVISYYGIWLLATFFVVLLALFSFSQILTMTTSPVALIEGLTMLLSPLRRLKLPVDDFALMALLALRFIPTLLEEVELLLKAQTSRGADLASGTLRERLQSLTMLFIPLIQGTLRRASDLATALEARGYEVEGRQTMLHETALARVDYLTMGVIVCVAVGTLLI